MRETTDNKGSEMNNQNEIVKYLKENWGAEEVKFDDSEYVDFKVGSNWYYGRLTKTGKLKANSIRLNNN